MSQDLVARVEQALTQLSVPTGEDVVSTGRVRDITSDESGNVRFGFLLQRGDPGQLVRQSRAVAESVDGVRSVKVDVQLPHTGQPAPPSSPQPAPPPKPGIQPGSVPAPTPKPGTLVGVKRIVAVSSGKGGVGKSMVATNLAAYAAKTGMAVGLMDCDVYGPNIPVMFGESRRPRVTGDKGAEQIVPLESHGVRLMSLGFLLERDQAAIMRGPLIAGILKQFVEQVAWGQLDLMVVDMPPGTGDAQLSLVQTVELDGALLVTTPQKVATGDVRRAVKMFERVNAPVAGIVENMAGFSVPGSDAVIDLFGRGGGEALATEMSVPFLGQVPLDLAVRQAGDDGFPTVLSAPDSPAGLALGEIGDKLLTYLQSRPPRS